MSIVSIKSIFFYLIQASDCCSAVNVILNFWSLSHPPFVWSQSLFCYIKQGKQQQPQFKVPSRVLLEEHIKSFHSECQRTIYHPSQPSRWKQKLDLKKKKKKSRPWNVFAVQPPPLKRRLSQLGVTLLTPVRDTVGVWGCRTRRHWSWRLQCRRGGQVIKSLQTEQVAEVESLRWAAIGWVHDRSSEGGAAAASAAPAQPAAGTGPMWRACWLAQTRSLREWSVLREKKKRLVFSGLHLTSLSDLEFPVVKWLNRKKTSWSTRQSFISFVTH